MQAFNPDFPICLEHRVASVLLSHADKPFWRLAKTLFSTE